ncbi:MAG: LysM peptidoglycan-binding domain-containing protein [Candidatus Gastranaerophilales bacterium]|nr:LysM peptidoglycan-binding domain-containing protein [Candidatus Gastranaerophilales bacterium]
MKSSTLHRASLSKEKMSMIENVRPQTYGTLAPDLNRYIKFQKKPELDVLWRDFEKTVQSRSKSKTPIVYAGVGFILGLLFALLIALIVGISMYSDVQAPEFKEQTFKMETSAAPVSIMPSSTGEQATVTGTEEKYTVKEGDTLDKIAFRFYGRYDSEKIDRIMELNNIKDPTTIQIGQVLIIPLD